MEPTVNCTFKEYKELLEIKDKVLSQESIVCYRNHFDSLFFYTQDEALKEYDDTNSHLSKENSDLNTQLSNLRMGSIWNFIKWRRKSDNDC
jgi:hypothetical protein